MRLWVKVFIVTLLLVVIATSISSVITLKQSRQIMFDQKINDCVVLQERLIGNIVSTTSLQKSTHNTLLLSSNDLNSIIETVATNSREHYLNLAVLSNEETFVYNTGIEYENYVTLINKTAIQDDIFHISSLTDNVTIQCISGFELDGEDYYLIAEHDVTSIYDQWDHQIKTLHKINFIVSTVISFITIILILMFISPIAKINKGLNEITNGNYRYRIPEKGSYEFKKLIGNVNVLSQSVLDNVEKIENIAEGRKVFIDNFAHEMKTPLTSIIGFSNLLRLKKNIPEEKRAEYAQIIEQEAERLRNLSSKLLELSTSEHITLEFSRERISDLFDEISITMQPALAKKSCSLSVKCDDSYAMIDKELFKSLLYNLIDNAIKASSEGGVIALECRSNKKQVIISVTDKGIGMTDEEAKLVAEPFYMVDKSRSRKENGVGLGLTLCTEIAKQHNSFLKIASKPGIGTTVYIVMNRRENNV